MKLQAVLLLAAVVLLRNSHAAVLTPKSVSPVDPNNVIKPVITLSNDKDDDDDNAIIPLVDNDSSEENSDDNSDFPDLDLEELRDEDLENYANAMDLVLEGELDLFAAAKMMEARRETTRRKRQIGAAIRFLFTAGRALFRSSVRGPLSRSGSRLTRQYFSRGNYNDAVRHFWNFRPQNVSKFRTPFLEGMTGTVLKYTVTVRSSSSSGRPTLEILSRLKPTGTYIRKFRFNK